MKDETLLATIVLIISRRVITLGKKQGSLVGKSLESTRVAVRNEFDDKMVMDQIAARLRAARQGKSFVVYAVSSGCQCVRVCVCTFASARFLFCMSNQSACLYMWF